MVPARQLTSPALTLRANGSYSILPVLPGRGNVPGQTGFCPDGPVSVYCFEIGSRMESRSHRPRNVGWARAAALLYGDWGTSKAYVIGAAFLATQYASLPIIIAVSLLTGLVGYNYVVVCKHFPDGGGVYSSARIQSRLLAVIGALLLVANFTVTAALSGWAAMVYFKVPRESLVAATVGVILLIGVINYFGPKHSGSLALTLAL